MIIFFLILIILILAFIVLVFLFAPQKLPWFRPHLILERSEMQPIREEKIARKPMVMEGLLGEGDDDFLQISLKEKVERLEMILNEKNKTLEKLQRELSAEKSHRGEFEKVKSILEAEILNLKTKNKEFKIKIGELNG